MELGIHSITIIELSHRPSQLWHELSSDPFSQGHPGRTSCFDDCFRRLPPLVLAEKRMNRDEVPALAGQGVDRIRVAKYEGSPKDIRAVQGRVHYACGELL